jgi:autotransporter-associated beta strand protein
VTLGTANDFTGPIAVNGGMLASSNATGLPNGAVVTVANGAAFEYMVNPGVSTRNYSFTIAGAGPDGNGAIQNNGTAAINENSSISNLTLSADASVGGFSRWDIGSGATGTVFQANGFILTKVSTNQITFRPETIVNLSNIVINAGIFQHENFNRTNASTATVTNIVNTSGTLSSYGTYTFNYPVLFSGGALANPSGTATWIGPMTLASNALISAANPVNFLGALSGSGALVKTGLGVLTLSNANTYAGGTIISNAPATAATNTAATAGNAAIVVVNTNGLGSGPVTINGSTYPSLVTNTAFFATNILRALEFNLGGGSVVANAINLPAASTLVTNVSIQGRDSNSVFTLTGQIGGGYSGLTNWFDCGAANNYSVTRLANNANNFIAGAIRVSRGNLAITGDGCLGNSANVLRMDQAAGGITGPGLRFDAANINVAHNILAASGTVLDLFGDNNGDGLQDTVNNATISGSLSGAGTIYVRGTNGTLTLAATANNTYSGGFELQQPVTLQVSASTNLGTAYVALKAWSIFRYTGSGSETMTRNLWVDGTGAPGGGTIDIPNATAALTWNAAGGTLNQGLTKTGAGAFILGGPNISGGFLAVNNGAMTVNSVISGGTVVQVNAGTLTLNGANTYAGPTLVNSVGTLLVNGSLPAANSVTVNAGGTLGGNGVINCPVSIAPGGSLQPGVSNNIGKLAINNTLALAGTTTMKINGTLGTNDSVTGISTVSYGGTLTVNNLGGVPVAGAKFTLFSAGDRLGTFAAINYPPLDKTSNLTWANLLSVDGSIQAVPLVATLTNTVVGNTLQLSWGANSGWRLLAQTNSGGINTPSTNWYPVTTSGNSISIPMDTTQPSVFYRLVYP